MITDLALQTKITTEITDTSLEAASIKPLAQDDVVAFQNILFGNKSMNKRSSAELTNQPHLFALFQTRIPRFLYGPGERDAFDFSTKPQAIDWVLPQAPRIAILEGYMSSQESADIVTLVSGLNFELSHRQRVLGSLESSIGEIPSERVSYYEFTEIAERNGDSSTSGVALGDIRRQHEQGRRDAPDRVNISHNNLFNFRDLNRFSGAIGAGVTITPNNIEQHSYRIRRLLRDHPGAEAILGEKGTAAVLKLISELERAASTRNTRVKNASVKTISIALGNSRDQPYFNLESLARHPALVHVAGADHEIGKPISTNLMPSADSVHNSFGTAIAPMIIRLEQSGLDVLGFNGFATLNENNIKDLGTTAKYHDKPVSGRLASERDYQTLLHKLEQINTVINDLKTHALQKIATDPANTIHEILENVLSALDLDNVFFDLSKVQVIVANQSPQIQKSAIMPPLPYGWDSDTLDGIYSPISIKYQHPNGGRLWDQPTSVPLGIGFRHKLRVETNNVGQSVFKDAFDSVKTFTGTSFSAPFHLGEIVKHEATWKTLTRQQALNLRETARQQPLLTTVQQVLNDLPTARNAFEHLLLADIDPAALYSAIEDELAQRQPYDRGEVNEVVAPVAALSDIAYFVGVLRREGLLDITDRLQSVKEMAALLDQAKSQTPEPYSRAWQDISTLNQGDAFDYPGIDTIRAFQRGDL